MTEPSLLCNMLQFSGRSHIIIGRSAEAKFSIDLKIAGDPALH